MTPFVRRFITGALAAVAAALSLPAVAQDKFPSRTITIILPAAAGGPADAVARLVADSMSRTFGQPVVVENVAGAGGTTGMGRLAAAAPDGHTLAVWHIAQSTAPALYDSLKYDVFKDFGAIGRIADAPMTLTARSTIEAKSLKDLIDWIKLKNSEVTYGHGGIGTASHLCMVMLQKELGVKMRAVSYRGTGPAMNDLLGGQFDLMCDQTTNTLPQIQEGKIKAFAVTVPKRLSVLPDLPTLDESGIKGFDVSAWYSLWAPKGLPKDVTDKLVEALKIAHKDKSVAERLTALGNSMVPDEQVNPDALWARLKTEVPRWDAAIKAAGVKGN